jgi:DNA-binding PadR family transcriptional regulator
LEYVVLPITRVTRQTVAVLKAFLDAKGQRIWGLALSKKLDIPTGSIYPMLDRLVELGWLDWSWEEDPDRLGPRRKLYSLTDEATQEAQKVVQSSTESTKRSQVGREQIA